METTIPQTFPFIETAEPDLGTDTAKMAHQPDSEVLPFMVTVRAENQRLHIELGNFEAKVETLNQELAEAWSQLETERALREEIEVQFSDLKQKSATASELPEAADLLNQLKTRRKKFTVSLADIEAILEMIKESWDDTSQGL